MHKRRVPNISLEVGSEHSYWPVSKSSMSALDPAPGAESPADAGALRALLVRSLAAVNKATLMLAPTPGARTPTISKTPITRSRSHTGTIVENTLRERSFFHTEDCKTWATELADIQADIYRLRTEEHVARMSICSQPPVESGSSSEEDLRKMSVSSNGMEGVLTRLHRLSVAIQTSSQLESARSQVEVQDHAPDGSPTVRTRGRSHAVVLKGPILSMPQNSQQQPRQMALVKEEAKAPNPSEVFPLPSAASLPTNHLSMSLAEDGPLLIDDEEVEMLSLEELGVSKWDVEPDCPSNLSMTTDEMGLPILAAASVRKMIEKFTSAGSTADVMQDFLLTYRSFSTPKELLHLLIGRFYTETAEKELIAVRLRVCNFMKHWVEKHFHDFESDIELRNVLLDFIRGHITTSSLPGGSKLAQNLLRSFKAQMLLYELKQYKKVQERITKQLLDLGGSVAENALRENMVRMPPPPPILPNKSVMYELKMTFDILEWNPLEIARQMCLIEYGIFRKIQPRECLNSAWTQNDKANLAPAITKLIDRFNRFARWVSYIVLYKECKAPGTGGTELYKHMVDVAYECYKLNNFNGVMEIIGSLQCSSIARLHIDERIAPPTREKLKVISELSSPASNFKCMRDKLQSCSPPCIPHIGMFLSDLTFAEGGNPDSIEASDGSGKSLVNFRKRQLVAKVLRYLQMLQHTPYHLVPVDFLKEHLTMVDCGLSDEQLYLASRRINDPSYKKKKKSTNIAPPDLTFQTE